LGSGGNIWRQKRTNIDLFLQSYLFIKIQEKVLEVKSEDKERFSRIDSIFKSYKELIKGYKLDEETIIRELKEFAVVYRQLSILKLLKLASERAITYTD
jgi:hypothetical protein